MKIMDAGGLLRSVHIVKIAQEVVAAFGSLMGLDIADRPIV
jgi:hypothetical protein